MSDGFQFFLLGVNSSTAQLPGDEEPLGLNAAVFASVYYEVNVRNYQDFVITLRILYY